MLMRELLGETSWFIIFRRSQNETNAPAHEPRSAAILAAAGSTRQKRPTTKHIAPRQPAAARMAALRFRGALRAKNSGSSHPVPLPIGWGEGVRRAGDEHSHQYFQTY